VRCCRVAGPFRPTELRRRNRRASRTHGCIARPDTETHFEVVTVDLAKVDAAPPAPHFYARGNAATRMALAGFDARWGAQDQKPHPAPSAQFVVYLEGTMSITTTDGTTRRFGPGDVVRVEDVAPCKGHISVAGDQPAFTMISR